MGHSKAELGIEMVYDPARSQKLGDCSVLRNEGVGKRRSEKDRAV